MNWNAKEKLEGSNSIAGIKYDNEMINYQYLLDVNVNIISIYTVLYVQIYLHLHTKVYIHRDIHRIE